MVKSNKKLNAHILTVMYEGERERAITRPDIGIQYSTLRGSVFHRFGIDGEHGGGGGGAVGSVTSAERYLTDRL
jgi:hypothetical protein